MSEKLYTHTFKNFGGIFLPICCQFYYFLGVANVIYNWEDNYLKIVWFWDSLIKNLRRSDKVANSNASNLYYEVFNSTYVVVDSESFLKHIKI